VYQRHLERERVLSPEVAFQMVTMLQDVVTRGTAAGVRTMGVRGAVGGKTGSTNEYRDAWFVGFSRTVVVGVWVGFDQPQTIAAGGSGARMALPIWAAFMRRAASRLPAEPFAPPAGLRPTEICRHSYERPVEGCPTYVEYFKDGDDLPGRLCPLHEGNLKQQAQRAVQGLAGSLGRAIRGIFQ
jgi:penicillin-binding protein 1A